MPKKKYNNLVENSYKCNVVFNPSQDIDQDMEYGRDRCENVFRNPICNASLAFADGQEARLVTSKDGRSANNHFLIFIYKNRWFGVNSHIKEK